MRRQISSSLGFVSMIGGVLFALLVVVMNGLLAGAATEFVSAVADTVMVLAFVFLLAGAIGLYAAQRDAFGPIGLAAAVVLVVGLSLTTVEGALTAMSLEVSFDDELNAAATVLLALGSVAFGAATAWIDELIHGRVGGVLLALSMPVMFAGRAAFQLLGVEGAIANAVVTGVPFGLAWVVLGLDLLTVPDQGEFVEPVDVH